MFLVVITRAGVKSLIKWSRAEVSEKVKVFYSTVSSHYVLCNLSFIQPFVRPPSEKWVVERYKYSATLFVAITNIRWNHAFQVNRLNIPLGVAEVTFNSLKWRSVTVSNARARGARVIGKSYE